MASRPASVRQTERMFVTPIIGDVLFSERWVGHSRDVPAYGTAHPNTSKWPNHKFVFAKERGESDVQDAFDFFYAADRANQDLYNWEFDQADIGGTKFDAVKRTYLVPRSSFSEVGYLNGTVMPDVPLDKFNGEWILASRSQKRTGEDTLDSLYVVDVHLYVRRAPLSRVTLDIQTGRSKRSITTLYYRTEVVSGTPIETLAANPSNAYWGLQSDGVFRELDQLSEDWFAVTSSTAIPDASVNSASNPAKARVIERVTPLGTDIIFSEKGAMPSPVPAYGSAHYDTVNFPNHTLSLIAPADASGLLYEFFYVAARANEDGYNWEHSKADIGGNKFDAVTRTYVTLRSSYTPDSPAMGTTMADVPAGKFSGTYVLAEKAQQRTNEQRIDNLFVIEKRTYVKKVALTDTGYDSTTGRPTTSKATLYYSGEIVTGSTTIDTIASTPTNSYLGLQTNGEFREVRQLSEKWWQVVERSVLPENAVNSASNLAKARVSRRVTPLGTDIMFTEVGAMPSPVPAYGSAHYDTSAWPNHKLALIEQADESGLLYKFTYVADRASQDDYNFEMMGGEQVIRTYIIPRALYFGRPVGYVGAVANEFLYPPPGAATPDVRFADYCFADDTMRRVDVEFDSIYVTIQRRFIRPVTVDYVYDKQFKRNVKTTKEIIPKTTASPALASAGSSVEIQDGNNYHSVRITQELMLVSPETYPYALPDIPDTQDFRFPPKLNSVDLVGAWAWASATDQRDSYSEDYYFKFKITDPRPGPYSATVKRWITNDPAAIKAANPITPIPQPIRESIAITAAWYYASAEFGNSTSAVAKEWSVPPTIHESITVAIGGTAGTSKAQDRIYTTTLAATPNVTAFLALTEVTIDYRVREMSLGLYEVSVVKLDITGLYA